MGPIETSMGGSAEQFPSTCWTRVLAAGDPANPEYRQELERLIRTYWRPVYAYVRVAERRTVEDAKDLTQAFFTRLLEKGHLERIERGRGTFRGYLKTALKHFLINAAVAERVRGEFRLDVTPEELERIGPATPEETPDQAFDRVWFRELLSQAYEAMRVTLVREGKEVYYRVFRAYHFGLDESNPTLPSYREVAERFGIKETDVRNHLTACRQLLRRHLAERIREYAATDQDAATELGAATSTMRRGAKP